MATEPPEERRRQSVTPVTAARPTRWSGIVRGFGPGLVSGASANDPTTVGSIAVVAAATGYRAAWLVVLLLPMLALVQSIAASVAAVSQQSLQQAIAKTYGRFWSVLAGFTIVAVGLLTLGADVRAGADALALFTRVPSAYFVIPLVAVAGWLLATRSYMRIERILASFTLVFLFYVAAAILAKPDWGAVAHAIFVPYVDFSNAFVFGALALLGTTLTGYVYFWESIEVAERRPEPAQFGAVTADAVLGMLVAGSSFLFILIATAATAGKHHLAIQTAADAATALKPLAGAADEQLFGAGLFASAAIAIPVIAATNGYVVAQTFGWRASLALEPRDARPFYGAIFGSLAVAGVLAFLPISTMAFLYWASIVAGISTPITLGLMLLLARNRTRMRGRPLKPVIVCAGWAVTGLVALSAVGFILSLAASAHRSH